MTKETGVRSLGGEDPQEEEMAAHSSALAWRIPWTEEPGELQSIESLTVGHDRSDLACTHASFYCWSYAAVPAWQIPLLGRRLL